MPTAQPPEIQVEAVFTGGASGETPLSLPKELYVKETPFGGILDLKVTTPNSKLSEVDSHGVRTITHPPSMPVKISYRIIQTVKGEFKNTSPIITDQFVHINGISLFAHPVWGHDQPIKADIQWLDIPNGWVVANSFGAQEPSQHIETTTFQFETSIFVAGDFDLKKIEIASNPVFVAVRGKWKFTHHNVVTLIRHIITAQREFWQDFDVPYYFILFMSNDQHCCGYGGHGLTHSFVSYFSPEEYSLKRFAWVLGHEHFHYWNGDKMMAETGPPEFWFTEGFTDYYARQINMRAGVITYDEFVDDINGQIYSYYSSPLRGSTNDQVAASESSKIPQRKGNTLGGEWNLAIRKATQNKYSLDDFIRAVLHDVGSAKLTNSRVEATLTKFVGPASRGMMEQIEKGTLILPSDEALGPCSHVEDWEMGKFEAGFDEPYGATVVKNLKIDSAAYKAGLREGQQILERKDLDVDKPWKQIELKIQDGPHVHWVKYLPQTIDKIHVPHFIVDKKRDRRECVKWFTTK